MFDFAWSEIALIGVVALIAIGPKDLPVAMKTVADLVRKARRMAGEFQSHVDEMVREANLGEVRDQINEIRNFDLRGTIERAVDQDGSLRRTLNEPLVPPSTPAYSPIAPAPHVSVAQTGTERMEGETATLLDAPPVETADPSAYAPPLPPEAAPAPRAPAAGPPAFIPPAMATPPEAPAFIPPAAARGARRPGGAARA